MTTEEEYITNTLQREISDLELEKIKLLEEVNLLIAFKQEIDEGETEDLAFQNLYEWYLDDKELMAAARDMACEFLFDDCMSDKDLQDEARYDAISELYEIALENENKIKDARKK